MMGILIADPRRFWPIWTPYQWLTGNADVYSGAPPPVRIDLWSHLPAIDPPLVKDIPINTAWITIASLAIVLLGYIMMRRWRSAQATRKLPLAAQGATWAVAILAVGASWYLLNFDYIQHKTVLTEVQRMGASPALSSPHGIEYMDGKIYVTDYEGASVGVFDLAAGSYARLQVTAGQEVALVKPGDIKKGPNDELYLLNNGENADAILVLKPDGTLVRKIALNGKTPIAAGLQIGSDGKIYIADVRGGAIFKYGPDGGDPLAQYRGKNNGFDNIVGLLVTPDGKIYAAESSTKVIQELDPDGNYVRSFAIGCSPFYMATSDDWLDVTCPNVGIVSVNVKTRTIQRTAYANDNLPALAIPTGITYGPDGRLYVVDGNTLVVYTVEH
jgi:outer membrane protein assembly factor BamB